MSAFHDPILLSQYLALAGCANTVGQTVGHPFDMVKVRLQMQGHGGAGAAAQATRVYKDPFRGLGHVSANEGLRGVYKGLVAANVREFFYSGLRVGLYEPFKEAFGATDPAHTPLSLKLASGGLSGMLAGALCNPLDILKVRFQAAGCPKVYAELRSVPHALGQIWSAEGLRGLYRGVGPNTLRAALITAAQVPSYDHIKHTMINHGLMREGKPLHFFSSVAAGLIAVLVTNPVDIVKTRIMNQRASYREAAAAAADAAAARAPAGAAVYRSPADCCAKILATEGPRAFYRGALAAWLRLGPHTICTFMTFEYLREQTGIRPL